MRAAAALGAAGVKAWARLSGPMGEGPSPERPGVIVPGGAARDHDYVRVYFCGTRGSTPVSGPSQARYGGNTSCVGLAHAAGPPTLVLDAGTGLQQLPLAGNGVPFRGSLLLSHLHWDHTHGMPFFRGGMREGHRVDVYLPEQEVDPEQLLARALGPPHFPIRPKELGSGWSFRAIEPGCYEIDGFSVQVAEIPHKGGRTFGFRVSNTTSALAYMPDHSPLVFGRGPGGVGAYHRAAVALARGVDVVIHDAQHTAAELSRLSYLGHSAAEYAVGLAEQCGAGRLALFHHDPWRTDSEIDRIAAQCSQSDIPVIAAFDGMVLDLPARQQPGPGMGGNR